MAEIETIDFKQRLIDQIIKVELKLKEQEIMVSNIELKNK